MRTFLRYMATGHYFRSPGKWTLDRDDAHDFGFVSKAMKVASKLRIPELELVLSLDGPEPGISTTYERFLLGRSHTAKRQAPGRRASRPAVEA